MTFAEQIKHLIEETKRHRHHPAAVHDLLARIFEIEIRMMLCASDLSPPAADPARKSDR